MAVDHSNLAPGNLGIVTKRVAMAATAGNAVQVTTPKLSKRIAMQFTTSDGVTAELGKYTDSGTDGAAIGNDVFLVRASAAYEDRINGGGDIYLAGSSNSGYCYISYGFYEVDGQG
jgi:hypothetical protein